MLNSKEIRNIKFSKSVGGYKQEEVDVLLDKVEVDYDQFERTIKELSEQIAKLNKDIEGYKNSQNGIQRVLVSAQELADQIIEDAKNKSEEIIKNAEHDIESITVRGKELAEEFERKANERKSEAAKEYDKQIEKAQQKLKAIEKATEDSIARQQIVFDKLKVEVVAFKREITNKYKEHLEALRELPDEVPCDPKKIAEILSADVFAEPNPETFAEEAKNEMNEEKNSVEGESNSTEE